ncbi:MAG TPA: metal-dependent hydrolase [Wenzhouxiangellaceae bacterium]|nr:metal-dependent hydrolase [Wenzhouxiangellaceae bacterium]
MDPFTQGVFGSLFAQAGARGKHVRPAAAVGFAGGLAPDLDVLIRSANDSLLAIEYHRHFTHALAFIPVAAMLVALVAWPLVSRWRPDVKFARVFGWSLLGVASHGVLDAMTSYGTRLLWPFSDERIAWNIISVIDPLFTAPLAILLGLAVWKQSRKGARIAALWAIFYLAVGTLQQHRAEQIVGHWADNAGIEATRVVAKPSFANLVLWRGLVDDGERMHIVAVRILPGRDALVWRGSSVPHYGHDKRNGEWPEDSRLERDLVRFRHFSDDWLFRYYTYDEEETRFVGDLRYAIDPASARPLWGIRLDPDRPAVPVRFERPARVTESEREAFLDRLMGRDPPP